MHVIHENLSGYDADAILHPGCPRCEGKKGLDGLCELDESNVELLWRRCLNTEYGGPNWTGGIEAGRYRNFLESDLGHHLYLIGCLLQTCQDGVWTPELFESKRKVADYLKT